MDVNAQSSDSAARSEGGAPPSAGNPSEPLPSTGLQPQTASELPSGGDKTLSAVPAGANRPRAASGHIGPYQLLEEIAVGGMGVVYKARHTTLGRVVALKTMRPDVYGLGQASERFDREMRAAARLAHPHIVPIYEVGCHEGRPFYTMAYVGGGSLVRRRDAELRPAREAVALVEKVARAVHYAHEQGVLHRDLKPGNVLLDDQGEPHVSDFGLAKLQDADVDLTETGAVLGTPAYMAPEQAAGRTQAIGPPTDVWSLGVILYELLTGRRPFRGDSGAEVKRRILDEEPPSLRSHRPDLAPALDRVVQKCLQKETADRYPSAQALADDLARYLGGQPVDAPPERWHRRPYWAAAVALGLAASLAAGTWLLSRRPTTEAMTADKPIVLVGDRDLAPPLDWLLGAAEATLLPPEDGFSFRTPTSGVLRLSDHVPWERYRINAQVRIDARERDEAGMTGEAGICFCLGQLPSTKRNLFTWCSVGFRSTNDLDRLVFDVWRLEEGAPPRYSLIPCFPPENLPAPHRGGGEHPWHDLGVEVSPEAVRFFWDGRCVRTTTSEELSRNSQALFKGTGGRWSFFPRDGLGLYIEKATASFRQVVVTHQP